MRPLPEVREADSHMILTADKGFTLVIMDKDIYIEKCLALLNDAEVQKNVETIHVISTLK